MAAASLPPAPNCGFQKVLRFGSLPTITAYALGTARATAAVNCANCSRSAPSRGVFRPRPFQTTMNRRMCARFAARAAFSVPRRLPGGGAVRPAFHVAVSASAPKPARRERLTAESAAAGSCWASESSTTPTVNACSRGPFGEGGGGSFAVVAGTGEVVVVGGTTGTPPEVDVAPGTLAPVVAVAGSVPVDEVPEVPGVL